MKLETSAASVLAALMICGCASSAAQEAEAPRVPQNAAAGPRSASAGTEPSAMSSRRDVSRHQLAQRAGYQALHVCTGLFTSEMSEELVFETLSRPLEDESAMVIDREAKTVSVKFLDDMPPRLAVWRGNMGCTQLPIGATMETAENLYDWPESLKRPDYDEMDWPMGDQNAIAEPPEGTKASLESVLDEAFKDQDGEFKGNTWGVAIIKDGKIVAERYDPDYNMHVSARTNSMCKSLSATLVGVGVQKGLVDVDMKAPLAAWRTPGDPRGKITLGNMLNMASGLWTSGAGNPQGDLYGSGAPASEVSVLNMVDAEPGTRYVYAGSDTIMSVMAVREAMDNGEKWISFPHEEVMWKIGMTRTVMETDWQNDFLGSGQCWSSVRDFGRFGLLYLNKGEWNGEQIFPADWPDYVSSYAPAQPPSAARGGAGYGAQFWLYDERQGMKSPGYSAAGAFGQYAMIVPDENLVVVRRGLDVGDGFSIAEFTAAVMAALDGE